MNVEKDLKKFIVTKFMHGKDGNTLADDESLFEKGIIDSMGVLELVSFIEKQFSLQVLDEELVPENFETVNKIKDLVERKQLSRQIGEVVTS